MNLDILAGPADGEVAGQNPNSKVVFVDAKVRGTVVPLLRWILSFQDLSLQFLEFLHFLLGLRSVARFAIQGGETEMRLRRQGTVFFNGKQTHPRFLG